MIAGVAVSLIQKICFGTFRQHHQTMSAQHKYRSTTLHVAIRYQCHTMVEALRRSGDFEKLKNTPDIHGHLPIHFATYNADLGMVQLQESSRCSIHVKDEEGCNLLHIVNGD
jgi:ankyrin repeat protein